MDEERPAADQEGRAYSLTARVVSCPPPCLRPTGVVAISCAPSRLRRGGGAGHAPAGGSESGREVVGRHGGAEAEGARQRRRLPPSHLRRALSRWIPRRCCSRPTRSSTTTARCRSGSGRPAASSSSRRPTGSTIAARWRRGRARPVRARVAVVNDTVTDAELKRLDGLGVRGIRFNLAQAGATTPEMIEPLAKRVAPLGWHIQINATAGPDPRDHADPRARAVADRLRPPRPHPAAGRRESSALRQGPRADRQRPHVGQAVGRVRRHEGRTAERTPTRAPSRARTSRPRPNASSGAATGRTPPSKARSRTMPCCSTC